MRHTSPRPSQSSPAGLRRLRRALLAGIALAAILTISCTFALAERADTQQSQSSVLSTGSGAAVESSTESLTTLSSDTFLIWGDWNCSGSIDVVDILFVLRHIAGFAPLSAPDFCPAVSDPLPDRDWGNTDCRRDISSIDGLALGRFLAGLPIPPPRFDAACQLQQQLPIPGTATPSPTPSPSASPTPTPSPAPVFTPPPTPEPTPSTFCDQLDEQIAIPDNDPSGAVVEFFFPETDIVADIDLCINITHDWVGDLIVTLTHLDTGTTAVLIDRPGVPVTLFGCSGRDIFVYLDDDEPSPVEDECGPGVPTSEGFFYPNNPLSIFNGETLNGTWTATVVDTEADFIGRVVGATIWYVGN